MDTKHQPPDTDRGDVDNAGAKLASPPETMCNEWRWRCDRDARRSLTDSDRDDLELIEERL